MSMFCYEGCGAVVQGKGSDPYYHEGTCDACLADIDAQRRGFDDAAHEARLTAARTDAGIRRLPADSVRDAHGNIDLAPSWLNAVRRMSDEGERRAAMTEDERAAEDAGADAVWTVQHGAACADCGALTMLADDETRCYECETAARSLNDLPTLSSQNSVNPAATLGIDPRHFNAMHYRIRWFESLTAPGTFHVMRAYCPIGTVTAQTDGTFRASRNGHGYAYPTFGEAVADLMVRTS